MRHVSSVKRLLVMYWLIVTIIVFTAITWAPSSLMGIQLTNTSAAMSSNDPQNYVGAEQCAQCHPSEYAAWNQSYHNNLGLINITDGVRYYWMSPAWLHNGSTRIYVDTPGSCANCHTTGYDPVTQTWPGWNSTDPTEAAKFLGVQCEVCHGPGMTMAINYSSTLCGQCHGSGTHDVLTDLGRSGHNNTLENVLASGHASDSCLHCMTTQGALGENVTLTTVGLEPISCVVCHSPHNATNQSQLRQETPTDTCKQCHDAPSHHVNYALFIEGPHEKAGLECTSCHGQGTHLAHGAVSETFNHTFGIYNTHYPYNQTDPMVCTQCHTESWATSQLKVIQDTVKEVLTNATQMYNDANTAISSANLTVGVDSSKVKQASDLAKASKSLIDYVNNDKSNGFHNPEKTYQLLSEAMTDASLAKSMAQQAELDATSNSLSQTGSQSNMYMYATIVIAAVAVILLVLVIRKR